jgi:hypothetical protein
MPKVLIAVLLLIVLQGCTAVGNVRDGYEPGEISAGVIEDAATYCSPVFIPVRFVGRWMLRVIAYPVPNLCSFSATR